MRIGWRDFLVSSDVVFRPAYVVFEEDSEVGKCYNLVMAIFSDLDVAKEYADVIHFVEDIFVADYFDYLDGSYDYLYSVKRRR